MRIHEQMSMLKLLLGMLIIPSTPLATALSYGLAISLYWNRRNRIGFAVSFP